MSTRLSSLLVQDGLVSAKRVADALQRQVMHGGTLDSNLLDIKAIEEDTLITYLGRACGLPTQPTGIGAAGLPQPEVLQLYTEELAQKFHAVPTTLHTGGVLRVLVTDEVEISDMDTLALTVKQRIEPWVILEFRFAEALEKVYGRAMTTRFQRLLTRSVTAHEGKTWPAPRLIDPIPRFGSSLSDLRLPGPPAPVVEKAAPPPAAVVEPAPVAKVELTVAAPAPVAKVELAVVEPAPVAKVELAVAAPAPVAKAEPAVVAPAPVAKVEPVAAKVEPAVVEAAPVQKSVAVVVEPAPVAKVEPVVEKAAPPVAKTEPVVEKAAPPVAAEAVPVATDSAAPKPSSQSGPAFSGIEDISLDEWMSAADWLSAANKVPPVEQAAAPSAPAATAQSAPPVAVAQPTPPVAPVSAAKPAVAAPVAATPAPAQKPAAPVAAQPSSASPGRRKGKRNKGGKEMPPQAAAKPAAPVAAPVAAQSKPAIAPIAAPVAAKPAVTAPAAQSKPAIAPVAAPVAAKPVVTPAAAASQPAVAVAKPVTAKVEAVVEKAAPKTEPVVEKVAAKVEAAPVAKASVTDAVPVPVDSGRLGEPAVKAVPVVKLKEAAPAVAKVEPPAVIAAPLDDFGDATLVDPMVSAPSAESPLPELRPPPRIAVALDEAGGASPVSIEAARELTSAATERDPIFEAVCRGVRSRAAFAAVFTIHGDVAFGRVALGETWLDRQTVGRVSVQLDRNSAFRSVAKGRLPFVGFVGDEAAAADPLKALGRKAPLSAAVLPILVRGKPVALVYLDDDGREVAPSLAEELSPLISEIGQSFARFVQSSKTGGLGASEEDEAPQEVQDQGTSALRPRQSRVESTPPSPAPMAPISDQPTTRLQTEAPAKPAAPQEAAPAELLHAQPTMPVSKISPVAVAAKLEAKPEAKPEAKVEAAPSRTSGKAGKGRSQKSPPSSSASPSAAAPNASTSPSANASKGAIATTDLTALLEKAAAAPRDAAAIRDIVIVGQSAVKPLIERLKDPTTSARMRLAIVQCLAELPVPTALEPLGERLFDSEEDVRSAAAGALRNFPPSSALSTLRTRLRDLLENSEAKSVLHAVEALGELRDTSAVQQLIDLLDHRDPRVVDAVGRSLQNITKQDFGRSRFRWSGWWRRHQSEPRLQWLLSGLVHPSALIRSASQDELFEMSGDVASYRYDQPSSERDQAARRWVDWWQSHGYDVI